MSIRSRLVRLARELSGRNHSRPVPADYEGMVYAALVRPGDVCFDVGAHVGSVSILLARLAGETGSVVAFEPVWPMFERMCQRIEADTHVKAPIVVVPSGLSDSVRDDFVHVPDGDFGLGSMARSTDRTGEGKDVVSYRCTFVTLDQFLHSTKSRPPDFVKIDVEGAEWMVLKGASDTFRDGTRPLMHVELFAPWERAFGYQPWEPLRWLVDRGYQILFCCPDGLVHHQPTASSPFPPQYEKGYNVVAFVPELHGERMGALDRLRAGTGAKMPELTAASSPNVIVG